MENNLVLVEDIRIGCRFQLGTQSKYPKTYRRVSCNSEPKFLGKLVTAYCEDSMDVEFFKHDELVVAVP